MDDVLEKEIAAQQVRSGSWRTVWHVAPEVTRWRKELQHLRDDLYLGQKPWSSREEAQRQGDDFQRGVDEMGFPAVLFVGPEFVEDVPA